MMPVLYNFTRKLISRNNHSRILLVATIIVFAPITFYSIYLLFRSLELTGIVTLLFILPIVGLTQVRWIRNLSHVQFIMSVLCIFILTRMIWILTIPTLPYSDYKAYHDLAKALMAAEPIIDKFRWDYFSYSMGYPVVLSFWYALFGDSLLAAKLLNLLLGTVSIWIFYCIARSWQDTFARPATILFLIWPSQLFYSSVLASEHLALLLFLFSILFLIRTMQDQHNPSLRYAAVSGVLVALGYFVRGSLIIMTISGVYFLLTANKTGKMPMRIVSVFAGAFLFAYAIYLIGFSAVWKITPGSQGLSTLLTGTNYKYNGAWNEEDGYKYVGFPSSKEANNYALKESLRRIFSSPAQFCALMAKKTVRLWGDESYAATNSLIQLDDSSQDFTSISTRTGDFVSIAQSFQVIVLISYLIGSIYLLKNHHSANLLILILGSTLCLTLLHSVFESQGRYHYSLEPMLFVISSYAFGMFNKQARLNIL